MSNAHTGGKAMNSSQLQAFRNIAAAMHGNEPQTWEWVGKQMSQRMFGGDYRRVR